MIDLFIVCVLCELNYQYRTMVRLTSMTYLRRAKRALYLHLLPQTENPICLMVMYNKTKRIDLLKRRAGLRGLEQEALPMRRRERVSLTIQRF